MIGRGTSRDLSSIAAGSELVVSRLAVSLQAQLLRRLDVVVAYVGVVPFAISSLATTALCTRRERAAARLVESEANLSPIGAKIRHPVSLPASGGSAASSRLAASAAPTTSVAAAVAILPLVSFKAAGAG